jgi:predicted Zn finger-like uncharacterized protein
MLQITCPGCGQRLAVRDQAAGKRVKCPKCGQSVPVPPAGAGMAGPGPARPTSAPPPKAPAAEPAPPAPAAPAPEAPVADADETPVLTPEPLPRKGLLKKNRVAADILGVIGMVLGLGTAASTFFIALIIGPCCALPLVIVPAPCAILAILMGDLKRHRIFGVVGLVLAVIGVILAVLLWAGILAGLTASMPDFAPPPSLGGGTR